MRVAVDVSPEDGSPWHSIYPLVHINSPATVWRDQPSLLLAEVVFLALWLSVTVHVFNRPKGIDRSRHIALWAASLVGGGAIELLTVLHREEIGNFYHSQAVVMLFGQREPLYMLVGCYGFLQYFPVALVWRVGLPSRPAAVIAGLLGSYGWALLDTVGLKYLWWTWHNGEPLYSDRADGVPIASSFWIMASIWALAQIFNWVPFTSPGDYSATRAVLTGVILGPLATVVLMNVPFTLIYHPLVTALGYNAGLALSAFRVLGVITVLLTCVRPHFSAPAALLTVLKVPASKYLAGPQPEARWVAILALFTALITLGFDPADGVRTSFGQPFHPTDCDLKESSFWGGFRRQRYVCPMGIDLDRDRYRECDAGVLERLPADDQPGGGAGDPTWWYTVCGTPLNHHFFTVVAADVTRLALTTLALVAAQAPIAVLKAAGKKQS